MKRLNEKGITLIEVLASIVLLMIIFLIFAQIFPQMSITNKNNLDKNHAINLAAEELNHWQNTLNTKPKIDSFKSNATIIQCSLEGTNNAICYYKEKIEIQHEKYREDFYVSIKLWEESELHRDIGVSTRNAYRVHVEIKSWQNDKKISETFGFIYD